ncbi:MAG: 2Fe-2S iron-sulfur cluster binding domain-containing protein [Candidatus Marinimicrobia bacterium]|nr:2Fe-2S iron-sulfur cluster binding domain-containing protein [Candidatus Neomarinimicrobiota bacterium]
MAKVISSKSNREVSVENGSEMRDACENLGVKFSCRNGLCGTCMIDILEGEENLSPLTEAEKLLKRDSKNRLACQCKIEKGKVKIDF